MVALIFVILFLICCAISLIVILTAKDRDTSLVARWVCGCSIIIAFVIFLAASIIVVPTQSICIMTRFGRVTEQAFENGMHFKNILDSSHVMTLRTQLFEDPTTSASKDLQDVTAKIAVNYHLDIDQATVVFRTIGHDYMVVIGNPILQETVKEITAKYNAEDMITNRAKVKADIAEALIARFAERGIIVETVNITDFQFSESFTAAIEAKVAADQAVLTAENKLRQVQVEAQQAEAKAIGEANAKIALAEGQAKANEILTGSLTPELLQYMLIQSIKETDKVITIPNGISLTLPVP